MSLLLRPGLLLLGRLRYAHKFLIIGLVLTLPLGWVSWAFVKQQSTARSFTSKELIGVRYVRPITALLDELVAARAAAVQGALAGKPPAGVPERLAAAMSVVDSTDRKYGALLGTTKSWTDLRDVIKRAATAVGVPRQVYGGYVQATDGTMALIQSAATASNLILDPEVDSYYVMDLVVTQLPSMIDNAARAVDVQRIKTAGADLAAPEQVTADYTLARAAMSAALGRISGNMSFASQGAHSASVRALKSQVDALTTTGDDFVGALNSARSTTTAAEKLTPDALLVPGREVIAVAVGTLGGLLDNRIGRLEQTERGVAGGVGLAALLAAYLFFAFYRSVSGSVAAVLAGTGRLAVGDFTRPIPITGRDELTDIAVGMNAAIDRMRAAVGAIAAHAHGLAAASEQVSHVSEAIGGLSRRTTQEAGLVAATAEEVSTQLQSVVAEQLAASIDELAMTARSATEVLDSANIAVGAVAANRERMTRLGESSRDISQVMHLITSIAAQTNLLALNATIEAARAGEAGLGFAVVANEVKDLARASAEAAQSIGARIQTIQVDAAAALESTSESTQAIIDIQDNQHTIAAAMEEQTIHAREIGASLLGAVDRTTQIAREVAGFSTTAQEASDGAADVRLSAGKLAAVAKELSALVDGFSL